MANLNVLIILIKTRIKIYQRFIQWITYDDWESTCLLVIFLSSNSESNWILSKTNDSADKYKSGIWNQNFVHCVNRTKNEWWIWLPNQINPIFDRQNLYEKVNRIEFELYEIERITKYTTFIMNILIINSCEYLNENVLLTLDMLQKKWICYYTGNE